MAANGRLRCRTSGQLCEEAAAEDRRRLLFALTTLSCRSAGSTSARWCLLRARRPFAEDASVWRERCEDAQWLGPPCPLRIRVSFQNRNPVNMNRWKSEACMFSMILRKGRLDLALASKVMGTDLEARVITSTWICARWSDTPTRATARGCKESTGSLPSPLMSDSQGRRVTNPTWGLFVRSKRGTDPCLHGLRWNETKKTRFCSLGWEETKAAGVLFGGACLRSNLALISRSVSSLWVFTFRPRRTAFHSHPTARNGRSGGRDDATRVVLVPTPVRLATMTIPGPPMPAARPSLVLRAASVSDVQGGKHGIGPSSRETNLRKQLNWVQSVSLQRGDLPNSRPA